MTMQNSRGAANVSAGLDRIASLVQDNFASLGIPEKIATDFAYRCDLLSDFLEGRGVGRVAAVDETGESVSPSVPAGSFDANEIGDEVPGPLSQIAPEEQWIDGHFTQERFQRLRSKVQTGDQFKVDGKVARQLRDLKASVAALEARIASLTAGEEVEEESEEAEGEKEAKKASSRRADDALLRRLLAEEAEHDEAEHEDEGGKEASGDELLRRLLAEEAEHEEAEHEGPKKASVNRKASGRVADDEMLRQMLAEEGMEDESESDVEANRPWGSTGCSPGTSSSGKANKAKYMKSYNPCYHSEVRQPASKRVRSMLANRRPTDIFDR